MFGPYYSRAFGEYVDDCFLVGKSKKPKLGSDFSGLQSRIPEMPSNIWPKNDPQAGRAL